MIYRATRSNICAMNQYLWVSKRYSPAVSMQQQLRVAVLKMAQTALLMELGPDQNLYVESG
eukprot:354682-Chlamydomonas_euryale.AAC.8